MRCVIGDMRAHCLEANRVNRPTIAHVPKGSVHRLTCSGSGFEKVPNPGEFDFRNYLRAQRIRLRLSVDDPQSVWHDPAGTWWPWMRRLGAVRAWSQARLVSGLDARIAP